ncbi:MAG TPA: Clp protease N-terminal domain-containing protein [Streptosporangiaceae bacterium]
MTDFPVSLDDLIAFVRNLQPGGGPLENLAGAMSVSARLDEQSDALIGYFVDQARRSGASWSQIGTSMGVTKQAAQQRFVARWESAEFSRFTARARNVLAAARQIAGLGGAEQVDAGHLVAGLLSEPDGVAAKVIYAAGLTGEQVTTALGVPAASGPGDADPAALRQLRFTDAGRRALRFTLEAAISLGHNYIGTEHLLLGVLGAGGDAAQALAGLGLTVEVARQKLADEFARIQAQRRAG